MLVKRVEPMTITSSGIDILTNIAKRSMPFEACGVVLCNGTIQERENLFQGDRRHGFDMMLNVNEHIHATWHSHPNGRDTPSEDDEPFMWSLADKGYIRRHIIVTANGAHEWLVTLL